MDLFLKDIEDVNNENRQYAQKRKIVALLNKSEKPLTIPGICKKVKLSVPTGTKLVNELIETRIIIESGKKETDNGRRPSLYNVDPNYAYCIGAVVLLKGLSFSVYNLKMDEVYSFEDENFVLENTPECLVRVVGFIQESISDSGIDGSRILGMGMGITGRVNSQTGHSYNYFNFLEISLADFLSGKFSFPVHIDNDTRGLGMAEQFFGKAKNIRNAFVVNLSRGLGMAIIANGEIVVGGQGFAGEFGHIQFADSERLCICGKRGCLDTEVSGHALEQNFQQQIAAGEISLLLAKKEISDTRYEDIIQAALEGDALSISLIHNIGFRLGKALGNMINLLNPGVIIIGGEFVPAKEILIGSVKSGMMYTTLLLPLHSCELMFSSVGANAASKGAAAIVLRSLKLV
ncbi:MAG: glucokinase [Bacteroidetes bacterium GWF2_42_66]|nr:MAG: glucokinase [Bacteroidetes bacterium GWA2_42_15]OFX97498.1 MAG: glucokinase [Bacteroidetes bacterium GWE2_42_39]OFY43807.1 MAG: glucokinase [Bacteroidetes bacterium GWF2_42_66]HBL76210.1 glucokinase [Prolixibacteraceae bacterium]HCR90885.1 glucokinase [Prolixibacteraceae bacterium]